MSSTPFAQWANPNFWLNRVHETCLTIGNILGWAKIQFGQERLYDIFITRYFDKGECVLFVMPCRLHRLSTLCLCRHYYHYSLFDCSKRRPTNIKQASVSNNNNRPFLPPYDFFQTIYDKNSDCLFVQVLSP